MSPALRVLLYVFYIYFIFIYVYVNVLVLVGAQGGQKRVPVHVNL